MDNIKEKDMVWYVEGIVRELTILKDAKFTGNVSFQLNFGHGGISNMLVNQVKSLKMPTVNL